MITWMKCCSMIKRNRWFDIFLMFDCQNNIMELGKKYPQWISIISAEGMFSSCRNSFRFPNNMKNNDRRVFLHFDLLDSLFYIGDYSRII